MSSTPTFKSLQELFPQVDLRILWAISIEHEEDINEAIEFILTDVLPAATKPDFSCILQESGDPEKELSERDNGPEHITNPDDKPIFPFDTPHCIGGAENQGLHSLVADDTKGWVLGQHPLLFLDADSRTEPEYDGSIYNNSLSLNLNHLSEKEDDNLLYKAPNQNDHFESLSDGGSKVILTEHITKFSELECADMALHADIEELFPLRYEDNFSVEVDEENILSTVSDNCESPMEYGSEKQKDINIQQNVCNELYGCSRDGCRPLNSHDLESEVYTPPVLTCLLSLSDVSEKNQHYQDTTTETYKDAKDNEKLNSFSLDVNYLEISSDENSLPISLATKSGHAVSTDVLEDSIKDAKNSKKSLVSSLETMVNMMQEVELLEGKAKQAKEEALVAGHHILCKVEELRQIVKKSKDENDMQSGQVYGERSILATEARELQSRLLRMSEERSKYLSVIEEKSLVSSLETMVNMMQEVELLEGKAKQAKEEALVAGHHILCKVEELRQIVKKSKDENDMQSGQVYGERSILATEARELQSRLLRMSEERSKYLSVIEEIFSALEVRKSAAKDIIAAADLEKLEKEEFALKALKEQELIRDAVVAESQKLEQEAEENSKLREFLMDRGRVVDSLQGEIAIICEDILSLKQRVDSRIPLTNSLLSSFSSSSGSSVNSSDYNRGSPSSTSHLTKEGNHEKNQKVEEHATTNPLDDWELCEK